MRRFGQLSLGYLIPKIAGRENVSYIRFGIIVTGHQAESGDAREREIGVIRVRLQRPHATQSMSVCFGSFQQEGLQTGKPAGQRSQTLAARDRIEIDVESNTPALVRG